MDFLQLVFGFVNAPLFATFLLGMFWKRSHRAWRVHWTAGRNRRRGCDARLDTGRRTRAAGSGRVLHTFPSTMAQNFWIAIFAWSTCFLVTVLVSLASRPKPESELHNLVYGLTNIPHEPNCRGISGRCLWR